MAKEKIENIIPLEKVKYCIPTEKRRHFMRMEYEKEFRREFLEYLASKERDNLKEAGLWDSLIDRTLARGKTPPGWGIHHKLPIHGGGQNDMDNMIFIRFAEHFQIHRYIDTKIEGMQEKECRDIIIPFPEGQVFIPSTEAESFDSPKKVEETEEERKARIEKNRREKKKEYAEKVKR